MLVTEYLYNQNSLPYKASISQQMNASVCMLCMICMIIMGLMWSGVIITARSVRMRVLHQPLEDLSIGYFKVGTSSIRASDVVPLLNDQAKEWRPWPDDDELLSVACSSLFLPPEFFC